MRRIDRHCRIGRVFLSVWQDRGINEYASPSYKYKRVRIQPASFEKFAVYEAKRDSSKGGRFGWVV